MRFQRFNRQARSLAILIAAASAYLFSGCSQAESQSDGQAHRTPQPTSQSPGAPDAAAAIPAIRLVPAFPKLTFNRPVFITHAGDGSGRLFIVEQSGRILIVENRDNADKTEVFLDIRDRVHARHNEEGLLSLVFHPEFKSNGQFFIYYSVANPKRNRIARYTVAEDDPNRADPDSEQIVLEVEQPYGNHNGSTLLFGPDGYLYASFGDGGHANDPHNNGQNLGTLLSTIIRIDINKTDEGRNYAIPDDNPFVNREDARPEIWAYGLRNVWRMSFDRKTGDLWAGDVGQNRWEEIDLITRGGNYGWNLREGFHAFLSGTSDVPLIDPVVEYGRRDGLSVTGGYVYRGERYERLQGVYLYADYVSGKIWGLRYEDGEVKAHREMPMQERRHITSFGEDAAGELYACTFDRLDGTRGRIFKIVTN